MFYSALLVLYGSVAIALAYDFHPSNKSIFNDYSTTVPVNYNVTETQLINGIPDTSYYINSYLRGCNGHEYLLISHAFVNVSTIPGFYRASIFDITEKSYSSWYKDVFMSGTPSTSLNITFDDFQFEAISPDGVSGLHTSSSNGSLGYDMTIKGSHPILYNFGPGSFHAGTGPQNEWAIPSGKTSGTLTVNNTVVQIDSDHSSSWYDRQWGAGVLSTGNWTWFELILDSGIKASIWCWDNVEPYERVRASTLQFPDGTHRETVVQFTQDYNRTYQSSISDFLYPLNWELSWSYGNFLRVSSVFNDQELLGAGSQRTAYEGFVTVEGRIMGLDVEGYGVVEMVDLKGA